MKHAKIYRRQGRKKSCPYCTRTLHARRSKQFRPRRRPGLQGVRREAIAGGPLEWSVGYRSAPWLTSGRFLSSCRFALSVLFETDCCCRCSPKIYLLWGGQIFGTCTLHVLRSTYVGNRRWRHKERNRKPVAVCLLLFLCVDGTTERVVACCLLQRAEAGLCAGQSNPAQTVKIAAAAAAAAAAGA